MLLINLFKYEINKFSTPHFFENDCCPCVFNFIGLPFELSKRLAEKYKEGMDVDRIAKAFNKFFGQDGKYVFKMVTDKLVNTIKDVGDLIWDKIPPGYMGIVGFYRRDNTGHCIVVGRTNDGNKILYDAQKEKLFVGDKDIIDYLIKNDIVSYWLLDGKNTVNNSSLIIKKRKVKDDVNLSIIDNNIGAMKVKKRRLKSSVSSKNKTKRQKKNTSKSKKNTSKPRRTSSKPKKKRENKSYTKDRSLPSSLLVNMEKMKI